MIARLERLAILVVLLGTACTVLPAVRPTIHAETRRVALPGEEADTLGETMGETEGSLVPVRTHDGRELWVREATLGGASLVPGTSVLLSQSGTLVTVTVTRSLDDFVEVDLNGARSIVPTSQIVARLHHGPAPLAPPPVAVAPPPPPPLTPLVQMVVLEPAPLLRAGTIEACSAGLVHVMFPDGSDVRVPTSNVHPLRVRAGDQVMALWNESPYAGVILATRDSLVRVRWEDETEQWVELTDVQSVEAEPTGALRGCGHQHVLVDEGARSHVGHVIACEGAFATVIDGTGTPRRIARESVTRLPLRVGDAIEARWNGTPYTAIVLSLGDRVHVRWYDASEGDVDPADIVRFRALEARASEPASCPDA